MEPPPCSGLNLEKQHAQQMQRTQNITHQPQRSRHSHYPSICDVLKQLPALWRGEAAALRDGNVEKSRRHVTRKHNDKWESAHFSAEIHQ